MMLCVVLILSTVPVLAVPVQAASYRLKFNSNTTASVDDMPSDLTGATEYRVPDDYHEVPKRLIQTFLGWAESSSASVPDYLPGETISLSKNTTLYAVWERGIDIKQTLNACKKVVDVDIDFPGQQRWIIVSNNESANLYIWSIGGYDPIAEIYDSDGNWLNSDDDVSGSTVAYGDQNFRIIQKINSGTGYLLAVSEFRSAYTVDDRPMSSSFSVTMDYLLSSSMVTFKANQPEGVTGGSVYDNDIFKRIVQWSDTPGIIPWQTPLSEMPYTFVGWAKSANETDKENCFLPGEWMEDRSYTLYGVWEEPLPFAQGVDTPWWRGIDYSTEIQFYTFTPKSTGTYHFLLQEESDTSTPLALVFLDQYNSYIGDIISHTESEDFLHDYAIRLTAGEQYYIGVRSSSNYLYLNRDNGGYSLIVGKTASLSYNGNGGSGVPSTQSGAYSYTIPSAKPTRTGYTFVGWCPSPDGEGFWFEPGGQVYVNSSTTLYAQWEDAAKPTGAISSTNNVASSQTVTLSLSDNDGVAGYYWGTSSNYSSNTYTSTSSTSVTKTVSSAGTYYLTVKDKSDNLSNTVSITYYKTTLNANGGSVSPTSVLTQSGKSFTLPTPTRSNYSFTKWTTSSDGSGTSYTGSYTVSSGKTLYAQWSPVDSTKPTGSISSTNNVASNQTATLSLSDNVAVAGYYWGTSSNYSSNTYTSTSSTSVTKTVSAAGTYYLTVKDTSGNLSNTVSITYYTTTLNANGGSVSPTSVLTQSGKSFTLPTPTRNNYSFSKWTTSSDGSGTSYTGSYTVSGNKTLYAQWTYIPVIVTAVGCDLMSAPNKTSYIYKEKTDTSGTVLNIRYSDGSSKTVTDTSKMTFSGLTTASVGTVTVGVTCEGVSASFNITVRYAWWQHLIRIFLLGFLWY